MPATSDNGDLSGTVIDGRYKLIELIASGAHGSVYKAVQVNLDRFVAIKILNEDLAQSPEKMTRFKQEARLASQLQHPNLVSTFAFGVIDEKRPYLVLQYVNGYTLDSLLKGRHKLSARQTARIFLQISQALADVHAHRIIHRDITPANIFLEEQNDSWKAYLADFGIAKVLEGPELRKQKLTSTGLIIGTPKYMSPEQCSAQNLDERSDIYSLGAVMYSCLIGHPPFEGNNEFVLMHKHVHELPKVSKEERRLIGNQFVNLLLLCLEKDPAKRIQSAHSLYVGLQSLDIHDSVRVVKPRWAVILLVFMAILGVSATIWQLIRTPGSQLSCRNKNENNSTQSGIKSVRLEERNTSSHKIIRHVSAISETIDDDIAAMFTAFEFDEPYSLNAVHELEKEIESKLAKTSSFDEVQSLKCEWLRCKSLEIESFLKRRKYESARIVLRQMDKYIADVRELVPAIELRKMFQQAQLESSEKAMEEAFDKYLSKGNAIWRGDSKRFDGCDDIVDFAMISHRYALANKYAELAGKIYGDPKSTDYNTRRMTKLLCQATILEKKLGFTQTLAQTQKKLRDQLSEPKNVKDVSEQLCIQAKEAELLDESELAESFQSLALSTARVSDSLDRNGGNLHTKKVIKRLVRNYIAAGTPDRAVALIEKQISSEELNGDLAAIHSDDLVWIAEAYYFSRNYKNAERIFRSALERMDLPKIKHAHTSVFLGLALYGEGKRDEAAQQIMDSLPALGINSVEDLTGFDGLIHLGHYYLDKHILDKANSFANKAASLLSSEYISKKKSEVLVHQLKGKIALSEGKIDEAEFECASALKIYKSAALDERPKITEESLQHDYDTVRQSKHNSPSSSVNRF